MNIIIKHTFYIITISKIQQVKTLFHLFSLGVSTYFLFGDKVMNHRLISLYTIGICAQVEKLREEVKVEERDMKEKVVKRSHKNYTE